MQQIRPTPLYAKRASWLYSTFQGLNLPTYLQQLVKILSVINGRKVFPWDLQYGPVTRWLLFFSHKRSSVFVLAKLDRNDSVWSGRWKGPWQPICWALPFFLCVCFFVLLLIVKYMLKSWKKMFANIISCSDQTGHCAWIKKQKQNQSETNVPLQQFLCGYRSVWLGCHYNYQTILSKGSVDLEEDANEKATCFWCLFCAK